MKSISWINRNIPVNKCANSSTNTTLAFIYLIASKADLIAVKQIKTVGPDIAKAIARNRFPCNAYYKYFFRAKQENVLPYLLFYFDFSSIKNSYFSSIKNSFSFLSPYLNLTNIIHCVSLSSYLDKQKFSHCTSKISYLQQYIKNLILEHTNNVRGDFKIFYPHDTMHPLLQIFLDNLDRELKEYHKIEESRQKKGNNVAITRSTGCS